MSSQSRKAFERRAGFEAGFQGQRRPDPVAVLTQG